MADAFCGPRGSARRPGSRAVVDRVHRRVDVGVAGHHPLDLREPLDQRAVVGELDRQAEPVAAVLGQHQRAALEARCGIVSLMNSSVSATTSPSASRANVSDVVAPGLGRAGLALADPRLVPLLVLAVGLAAGRLGDERGVERAVAVDQLVRDRRPAR